MDSWSKKDGGLTFRLGSKDFEDEDHVNEIGVVPLVPILESRLHRQLLAR